MINQIEEINELTVFDLFSGGGGFRQGVEKVGMNVIAHCEIDKYAEQFYKQAFNIEGELYYNDATKINTRELPNFDVLLAGFPCQAFSIAGKRQGFKDVRGTMFFEVARILRDKRPKYFILENVKGLLNHDGGKTFQTILKILTDIRIYSIEWGVLNSKYFGVPQNRERVFIVGYPREYGIGKVFPLAEPNAIYSQAGKTKEEIHNIAQTLKARDYRSWEGNYLKIGSLRTSENKGFREMSDNTCPCKMEDGSQQPVIMQLPRGNNQGEIKTECPTITKNQWEYNNLLIEKATFRRLTPLECFRLQGFSDEVFYKGSKNISDAQLYKIAGNSVTVNVVYEIAKKIVELDKEQ